MSFRSVFFALLLAAGLFGCGKQAKPRHIVILPDVSGSINRTALEQAFKAIDELVGHLHRGDLIAIIPILGDAEAEASGRIIRFQVPTNRQAYDSDLRGFRLKLKKALEQMESVAIAHPGSKSDILGSIALADQEFQTLPESEKHLAIMSDFIQEDNEFDFRIDARLASQLSAKQFAAQLLKANALNLKGVKIYFGLLYSHEYATLRRARREAVQVFWIEYCHAFQARFIIDGPSLLRNMP